MTDTTEADMIRFNGCPDGGAPAGGRRGLTTGGPACAARPHSPSRPEPQERLRCPL